MANESEPAMDSASTLKARFEHENRSRNLLARLRSIISRMAVAEPSASDFAAHLEGRLSALWRAEEAFMRDGSDLELILLDELQTVGATTTGSTVLNGPSVRLDAKASGVIILAIHELVTNAVKFGAFAHPDGHLMVSWILTRTEAGSNLRLKWSETGVPVVAKAPRHEGFGHDLITRRISYELGGTGDSTLKPGGITCVIEIPLQS